MEKRKERYVLCSLPDYAWGRDENGRIEVFESWAKAQAGIYNLRRSGVVTEWKIAKVVEEGAVA